MATMRRAQRDRADRKPGLPGRFLYSEVATELRNRIARGHYEPGSRLPSLAELTREFDVSAITIRHALRELGYEGLVAGQQGRGVFVRPRPKIHRVLAGGGGRSIGEEIERAGFAPRIEALASGLVKADRETARHLQVPVGTRVHRHEKLTFADTDPVALHTIHMLPALAHKLGGTVGEEFVLPLLRKNDIAPAELQCEFSAFSLPLAQSELFGLPAGSAMMRVQYTPLGKDGKPLFWAVMICRADRFVFDARFRASGSNASG
jgi:GntR family transcriptional regulator